MSNKRPKSGKAKYKLWVEPSDKPVDPVIAAVGKLLPKIILEFAILEDVTGPLCGRVVRDQYQGELALRLRDPITKAIQASGLAVTEEQMNQICWGAAGETFVVRGLNEARLIGDISLREIKQVEFYHTYKDYFEQSPEIVTRAFEIAIVAAMVPRRDDANN